MPGARSPCRANNSKTFVLFLTSRIVPFKALESMCEEIHDLLADMLRTSPSLVTVSLNDPSPCSRFTGVTRLRLALFSAIMRARISPVVTERP